MTLQNETLRVWVAGGRGMLGQQVMRDLTSRSIAAVATGSELDIANQDALLAFVRRERPTHLINCAAMTAVDLCETQQEQAHRVNAEGPKCLGKIARACNLKAAHVSTDYVFSGESPLPLGEEAVCAPKTVYGASKLAGEKDFLSEGNDACLVVRTSWLFGPFGSNFVSTMLRLMAERDSLDVVADQVGRPTSTYDLSLALLSLLGLENRGSLAPAHSDGRARIYHFANAGEVSWFAFAQTILSLAQKLGLPLRCKEVLPTTSEQFKRPAPRPKYSVLDTGKIAQVLGAGPQRFEVPLRTYLEHCRDHRLS